MVILRAQMRIEPSSPSSPNEADVTPILEWLGSAQGRTGAGDAEQLQRQLLALRDTPIPTEQRVKLLDLFFIHVERIVRAELPELHEVTLPVSRRLRQRVRILQELLETATQDYFNTLAELFDPEGTRAPRPPQTTLRRIIRAISWNIQISHLVASPPGLGLWQQLHAAFHTGRRLGLVHATGERGEPSLQEIYASVLLAAIAQPASFRSHELEFITEYIEACASLIEFEETPPADASAIFWIDLEKDFPAHALVRRIPAPDAKVLYFACDLIAHNTTDRIIALDKNVLPANLGLPEFAGTPAGRGVLKRLYGLWGQPAKRKFPRRRQSYRANLCSGLEQLWHMIKHPANTEGKNISEWMVTNESPDGYSLMHMSGPTEHLRIGDIVAVQPIGERQEPSATWHVCLIRWALSENPEHIELGLQLLASRAIAAEIARPLELESTTISALILPETPPLRKTQSLIVPTGLISENSGKLIVLVESDNLEVREIRATALDEQTTSIQVFTVEPDETP